MAVARTDIATRTRYYDGGVYQSSTDDIVEYWNDPDLVRGSWRDLGNGYRFRRPTEHYRSRLTLSRGAPMVSEGYRVITPTERYNYGRTTSAGGYGVGNFFSGNFVYRYDRALGVPDLRRAPSFTDSEENESVTKSLNKLADQKVNIGENLATLGQTARMFINPVRSFVGAAKAYHNLPKLANGREIPWGKLARMSYRDLIHGRFGTRLAQGYLEYVYGFAPLMQDIYEIHLLAKSQAKAPLIVNGRGSAERSGSAASELFLNWSELQRESWEDCAFKSKTRTTLWAKLSDEYAFIRTLNQLGLTNPQSLVWELVPYSFVIDWVLPIGPVLSAMSAPAGLDFLGGSTSRRLSAFWGYNIDDISDVGDYVFTNKQPATGQMRYEGYNRKVITDWPRPGLWWASDPLGLHRDGSDRLIKGLALAIAALPRSL